MRAAPDTLLAIGTQGDAREAERSSVDQMFGATFKHPSKRVSGGRSMRLRDLALAVSKVPRGLPEGSLAFARRVRNDWWRRGGLKAVVNADVAA